MAKQVNSMPPNGGRKYPWEEWLNGKAWEAQRGEDFDCDASVFRRILLTKANRANRTVTTRVSGDKVTFQFKRKRKPLKANAA